MIGCLVFRKVCHNECWKEVIGHYSVFIKLEELRVPFQKMREKNSPMVTHPFKTGTKMGFYPPLMI